MIEINKKNYNNISQKELKNILEKAICFLKIKKIISNKVKIQISLALINQVEIRKINFRYRKKDEPTDVLSFCFKNDKKEIEGEIIISPETILENAKKDKKKFKLELKNVLIHGLLHIIGLEHSKKMFKIQDEIATSR